MFKVEWVANPEKRTLFEHDSEEAKSDVEDQIGLWATMCTLAFQEEKEALIKYLQEMYNCTQEFAEQMCYKYFGLE